MNRRSLRPADARHFIPTFIAALVLLVAGAHALRAQAPVGRTLAEIQYNSGQTVQPIFEGWTRNRDGSFELHFGYLNRNYVQQLHAPIGAGNAVEPSGPDRGQPTFFYRRFNRRVFSVTVPKDFGKKEVVWTLTTQGKAERAVGWLQAEWEIEEFPGAARDLLGDKNPNQPPALTVAGTASATLSAPLTLTADVTDDGLPKPRKPRVGGSENPPTFRLPAGSPGAPTNVPSIAPPPRPRINGLSLSWIVHRGPAAVEFEPAAIAVKDPKTVVTATFTQPGEYVLRAVANDTAMTTTRDIKVTVADNRTQTSRP
jgi:hypothetical protein